jgi:hypothetical protein
MLTAVMASFALQYFINYAVESVENGGVLIVCALYFYGVWGNNSSSDAKRL